MTSHHRIYPSLAARELLPQAFWAQLTHGEPAAFMHHDGRVFDVTSNLHEVRAPSFCVARLHAPGLPVIRVMSHRPRAALNNFASLPEPAYRALVLSLAVDVPGFPLPPQVAVVVDGDVRAGFLCPAGVVQLKLSRSELDDLLSDGETRYAFMRDEQPQMPAQALASERPSRVLLLGQAEEITHD